MQSISISITAEQLEKWGCLHLQGPRSAQASGISTPESPQSGSLVFLKPGVKIKDWKGVNLAVLQSGFTPEQRAQIPGSVAVFETTQFRETMGQALAVFDRKISAYPEGVSLDASVHASARIGKNPRIAARAVIGEGVVIGDNVWIGSGAVIEAHAQIGNSSQIHANTVIGHHCHVGNNCEIHSNTTLGSDGFGFIPQKNGPPVKIPQVGRVVVGDHVEIGANCAIDRGAIGDTMIGSGTKFDNLCHVAHNCQIGQNCLITAGFFMAGSSTIGDRFFCGGNIVIADHIHITHDVSLGGRSAVTKDITQPGAYTGYPLEPMKDGLKTLANLRELTRLRKDVADLRRHLNLDPS